MCHSSSDVYILLQWSILPIVARSNTFRVAALTVGQTALIALRDTFISVCSLIVFDKAINDIVLQHVHCERKDEHDECYLKAFVAFGPAECPIANPSEPRQGSKEEKDKELHAQ